MSGANAPKVVSMERNWWGDWGVSFTVCLSVLQWGHAICNLLVPFITCGFPFAYYYYSGGQSLMRRY